MAVVVLVLSAVTLVVEGRGWARAGGLTSEGGLAVGVAALLAAALLAPRWCLDRLVHEPARLAILTVLASAEDVQFTFLEKALRLTRGNRSSHVSKLAEAGYISVTKASEDKVPMTRFRITVRGRKALEAYRVVMLEGLSRGKA